MLTSERLKELLQYDPDTGVFRWLVARGPVKAGTVAGSVNSDGYAQINIEGITYRAHRLAFLYMTGEAPEGEIDHIDKVRTNNQWDNLRPATHAQNARNRVIHASSKLGIKGVQLRAGRYVARIKVDGQRYSLGSFDSVGEAAYSYALAAQELHGEFGNPLDFDEILKLDWLPPLEAAA